MAEFALLMNGDFIEMRIFDERPVDIPHKGVRWFPVIRSYGEQEQGVEGDSYTVRTADPSTLPPTVPQSVSPRQARLALLSIGKLDAANAAVASSDMSTRIAWEFSIEIQRDAEVLVELASSIGLTGEALDALFIGASKL